MKKSYLFLGLAMAAGLTACDDMLPMPEAVTNPQLPLFEAKSLVLKQAETVLDLQAYADQGIKAPLATIESIENFPEAATLYFNVELATKEDFSNAVSFNAPVQGKNVVAIASDINDAIARITKDPDQLKVYTRFAGYATVGNSTYRLGDNNAYYFANYSYDVKPFAPAVKLSRAYTLQYRASAADAWTSVAMNKAFKDQSVYDNGLFAAKIDIPAAGYQWQIVANDLDNLVWGVGADFAADAVEGTLVGGGAPAGLDRVGPLLFTFDALKNSFKIAFAFECLYVATPASSTSDFNKMFKLFTEDYIKYSGTMTLKGSFYLTGQPSNEGTVYLYEKDAKMPVADEKGIFKAPMTEYKGLGEGQNFYASSTLGLYYIEANTSSMEVKTVPVKTISMIGDYNGWNLETALDLKPNARLNKFTLDEVVITEKGGFKFCVDHDWAYSYGGTPENIVQNGGDMQIEPGTYSITLDFSKQPNTLTVTKK